MNTKATNDKYSTRKPADDDFIGRIIENRYTVLSLIGNGGMMKVYLVLETNRNAVWAMVVYEKKQLVDSAVIQEIIMAANKVKKLDHPAIPRVVDIVEDEFNICIIREYIEGATLDAVVHKNGPIGEETVLNWARQLCDVLGYLHKQNPSCLFGGMRPSNVILQPCGNVKLVDFQESRVCDAIRDQFVCVLGPIGYTPPEQYGGILDPRSDIFSLGKTLHFLLTGVDPNLPPYETEPIREINPDLSPATEAIILRCTDMNPDKRYQTCDELMDALCDGPIYPVKRKGLLQRFLYRIFGPGEMKKKNNM